MKLKSDFSVVVKQEGGADEGVGGRIKRQLFQQRGKLMISSMLLTLLTNSASIRNK